MMTPTNRDHETRAVARLPNLDIDIRHRRFVDGDGEEIAISLKARPSFEAFGRFLDASPPLLLWMRMVQLAWSPWLPGLLPPHRRIPLAAARPQ